MSNRAGMFVTLAAMLLAAGCTQRHILRMSNPEQATTVTLLDAGDGDGADDDTIVVLEEAPRIRKVAAFFKARATAWQPASGGLPVKRRYRVSFRKGDEVTDRFWLEGASLGLTTPEGKDFTCELTSGERAALLETFRVTTNSKSQP